MVGIHCNISDASEQEQTYAFPMSFAQQRLWILDQLARDVAAYNMPRAYRLLGSVSVAGLETALHGLVDRHESLRTTFASESGSLLQVVHGKYSIELPLDDLSALDAADSRDQRDALVREEVQRTFDLATGPLFRCRLIKVKHDEYVLILNAHHIVSDGWSCEVFERDLGELYDAALANRAPELPELPIQYADYSVWQREWLTGDVFERQMRYWPEQLKDMPVLQLQTDFPRPAVQTFHGASVQCEISSSVADGLRKLGQQAQTTLFMTLLTAFYVLLARYSGQSDIAIGSPFAGRNRPELEEVIGFFVNSLVLRINHSGSLTYLDALQHVREVVLDALSHQDLPFEKLVAELLPNRDTDRNPLFQVMFSLQGAGARRLAFANADIEPLRIPSSVAKVDLTLFVKESEDTLLCTLNYNTDLFTQATARTMLGHFSNLLIDVAANPNNKVSSLRLLDHSEESRIVHEWNETVRDYPRDATLKALFAEQVAAAPNAIAVRDEHSELSYSELDSRSNQLAHYLLECGVEPDQAVGLAVSRSVNLLICILGIIKAGGAYLPLDTSYPRERQDFMLRDARVKVLVTEASQAARLSKSDCRVINLDRDRRTIESRSDKLPLVSLASDNLAYIVYTSGSTGTPKGVCIEHRAVSRLIINTDYVQLGKGDRVAQISNVCFDAATFEIWGALLVGATLEIISRNVLLSPEAFATQLARRQISTMFITTALFNQLAGHSPNLFAGVGTVMFGGEAVDVESVRNVLDQGKPPRLLHVYGPTECTTFATWHEVTPADAALRTIPIGRPISNTRAYVLDEGLNAVPVGVIGELYLGGDGLARGYLNQPELTAEKFIADPFMANERLYKTGDLVRFRPDGAIEFIGRFDNQVKIRGYRIEPGEIESQLNRHAGIESSLVLVDRKDSEDERMVAYVVPVEFDSFKPAVVRDHLAARVPEFMVPAAVVPVQTWPLTANGKIDRTALPKPAVQAGGTVAARAPKTQIELHLCKIWEDVLGVDNVGVTDNFFELGGHSLLAVRLFDAIERLFGKRIPMDTLWYEGGTVETLARILQQDQSAISWPTLVQMQAEGSREPLFFVHTMGGNLFHYDDLVRELGTDRPVYGLQARGVYGMEHPCATVEAIAADCIDAMKSRQSSGPYGIVGFSSGGLVAYEMAQQLRCRGEQVGRLILVDTYAPELSRLARLQSHLMALLRFRSARDFQERFYHLVLHNLGLDRFRNLEQVGEAHRWAHWSYVPRAYSGEVCLFVAEENENTGRSPVQNWRPRIGNRLITQVVPGTHGDMVRHPHVKILSRYLNEILGQGE